MEIKTDMEALSTNGGIYCFRNKVNGKYYVGQALNLRTRFQQHLWNLNHNKYNTPLYKAFAKYGLNNFDYQILEEFEDVSKEQLDQLEREYISKLNSYGNTGYNQTLGGDGGILGYKFTDEQKQRLSDNTKKWMNDGRNKVFVYIIDTKEQIEATSVSELSKLLGVTIRTSDLRHNLIKKKYIIARTMEELEAKKNKVLSKPSITENDKEYFMTHTYEEIMNKYGICKKSVANYKHKFGLL